MISEKKILRPAGAIYYRLTAGGFDLGAAKSCFAVRYPKKIFNALSQEAKNALAQNFIYCRFSPLALATGKKWHFQFPRPVIKNFIDAEVGRDLPRVAFCNRQNAKDLIIACRRAQKNGLAFDAGRPPVLRFSRATQKETALLALSFGKDSILSYALAKEIKWPCRLVFVNEMEQHNAAECRAKKKIIRGFSQAERQTINLMAENADEIYLHQSVKLKELDNANGMMSFALELLPFANFFRTRYLILGNEKNFDDTFNLAGNCKAYPSTDQSSRYTRQAAATLQKLTAKNYAITSLVEPLYNLAEMQILFHRYPRLLPYIMSCTLEEKARGRWCYRCPSCAQTYLYALAVGGDPRKLGFKKNMFKKTCADLFPLFHRQAKTAYEMPPAVRDEQLLAFLLAYRQGRTGELMAEFEKKYLAEAKRREKALRRKFFRVYPSKNIPQPYYNRVLKIYREELRNLI